MANEIIIIIIMNNNNNNNVKWNYEEKKIM
jgi:hypothetical protein